ncbi:MAG TPA: GPR1/FUN34/YaaH family transporter [Gaiellaceae bacterium]|nr:GPR1/FUN34/YaaH family transporter [Gaiellaceae bacterium]
MSTIESSRRQTELDIARDGLNDGVATRIFLQPIAAPSILGLFGFAGATFIVASNLAGWWGTPQSGLALAPFAAMFGGLAQFLAGMWAYRARDAVATAMHGTWGAFWLAYGILNILVAAGALTAPKPWYHNPELGFWFFALAFVTGSGALASLAESVGLFAVLSTLAAGSGILAGSFIYGSHTWTEVAGWVLVFSAGFAWYVATAMMLAAASGRVVLPLGKLSRAANRPGRRVTRPIELEWAEPGIRMGQ